MNSSIIDCFQKLIHKTSNDLKSSNSMTLKFKLASYRKTLELVKSLKFDITNTDQIKDIKGVGKTTIEKINEILETGTLKQILEINETMLTKSKDIADLQKITGIGPAKAQKLYDLNITLKRLLELNFNSLTDDDTYIIDELTHHQLLGVKYYHDLEQRIPYAEIQETEKYLNKLLKAYDSKLHMIICGSYRRKKETSGDIDILLYHDDVNDETDAHKSNYLTEFLELLISKKFLTDHLTAITNPTKYMGFGKYKKYNRRIDIRLVPTKSIGSAMLYFTGSGEFNKSMRTYALKKGYTINEYGIYKLKADGTKGVRIKTESEDDIFKVIKLDYVEPEDRLPSYEFKL
jgi:DNA polymerase beta